MWHKIPSLPPSKLRSRRRDVVTSKKLQCKRPLGARWYKFQNHFFLFISSVGVGARLYPKYIGIALMKLLLCQWFLYIYIVVLYPLERVCGLKFKGLFALSALWPRNLYFRLVFFELPWNFFEHIKPSQRGILRCRVLYINDGYIWVLQIPSLMQHRIRNQVGQLLCVHQKTLERWKLFHVRFLSDFLSNLWETPKTQMYIGRKCHLRKKTHRANLGQSIFQQVFVKKTLKDIHTVSWSHFLSNWCLHDLR